MRIERTKEETEIGEAYWRAEESWQNYRSKTGDHSDGLTLSGSEEKDAIRQLWEAFFALYEPYTLAHPAPRGLRWGIAYKPFRPSLYAPVGEIVFAAYQTGFNNVGVGI